MNANDLVKMTASGRAALNCRISNTNKDFLNDVRKKTGLTSGEVVDKALDDFFEGYDLPADDVVELIADDDSEVTTLEEVGL